MFSIFIASSGSSLGLQQKFYFISYCRWWKICVQGACLWVALLLRLLIIFNVGSIINMFKRVVGELFSILISILFMKEDIKACALTIPISGRQVFKLLLKFHIKRILLKLCFQGLADEFRIPKNESLYADQFKFPWHFANGLSGIVLYFVLFLAPLKRNLAWLGGRVFFLLKI